MLKVFWKSATRVFLREKGYAAINIIGLAFALTFFFLLALFVRNELSYDASQVNADRLYRIGRITTRGDNVRGTAYVPTPLGPALERDFPEIERTIRFWRAFQPIVGYESELFQESGVYFTDPDVFETMTFPFVEGDPATALQQPNTVVLTRSMARKYFGDADPLGKTLSYEGYPSRDGKLKVTGVMRDLPDNSQFDFGFLVSMVGVETERNNWGSNHPVWTYVLLAPHSSVAQVNHKLEGYLERYYQSSAKTAYILEPLRDVHLYSRFTQGFKPAGDINQIYLFSAIGFFILLLACVNFINLATARSLKRLNEVGMRKTLGAPRWQLVVQFIGEAMLMSALAVALAILLLAALLPTFNTIFGTHLTLELLGDATAVGGIAATLILVGLLAGSYPAVVLAGFNPLAALRGGETRHTRSWLRKGLVIFQFVVSITLIIGTLVVQSQLDYIRQKKLGFDKDLVVVLPDGENEQALLNELGQNPNVLSASVSQRVPVNDVNADGRTVQIEGEKDPFRVESYVVDNKFLQTYQIGLAAGRGYSPERPSDDTGFLINETAARTFGWTPSEALGKQMTWSGSTTGRIIGVVRDFNMTSLHKAIEPLVMLHLANTDFWRVFISVRIAPNDIAGTLRFLESTWRTRSPKTPFRYFFIDESLARLHEADDEFGRIFATFASLAIIIACLGLFGLAAFSAQQRTKEVGIRKVLGASAANVVLMLSREFLALVAIATLLAWPLAYVGMNYWLGEFAYRIQLGPALFLTGGLVALGIALVTVGYQAMKAAWANPVDALRYE